jgi:hypothetical protein
MVGAKGKTVGRLFFDFPNPFQLVVRQINGIWVIIPVTESVTAHPFSNQ